MPENHATHARQSTRLNEFDYSLPGAYFVTLVTIRRECLFGKIIDAEIRLSPFGKIAHAEWFQSLLIRNEIKLYEDEFVVMPNHIHGIVWITPHDLDYLVKATGRSPLQDQPDVKPGSTPKYLGSFVAGYKASVTKQINLFRNSPGQPVWMRNYHDRIIRNEGELKALREYIRGNPLSWELDRENPQGSTP